MQRNYTNKSIVKNIDTAFSYYKFPPSTTVNEFEFEDFDLDFDIDQAGFDPVSGMHRVAEKTDSLVNLEAYPDNGKDRLEGQWEYLRKIPNIYADVEGEPTWNGGSYYGFTDIPFKQTIDGNKLGDNDTGFVITPDIKKLCQEGKKTIKFTVVLNLKADATGIRPYNINKGKGDQDLMPDGPASWQNCEVQLRLKRTMPTKDRSIRVLGPTGFPIYDKWNLPAAVMQWDYYGTQVKNDDTKGVMRTKHGTYKPTLRLEYIIDIEEAEPYDIWRPQVAGQHNIFFERPTSYWLIELIDDPGVKFADPNKRKKFYGKQRTNPAVDRFWTTKEERDRTTKYDDSITIRLDAAPEIKARKNAYATIKAKNQNVKQLIASNLRKKAQLISVYENITWAGFIKRLQKKTLAGTVTTLNTYSALIWTAKNQPKLCIDYILRGWEVYLKLDVNPPNLSGLTNTILIRQAMEKFQEVQRALQDGTLPAQANLGTISGFYSRTKPVRTEVQGLLKKLYQGFQSGLSKSPSTIWNTIGSADKRLWAEAIRTFLVGVYDSVDPGEAQSNKTQQYWAGVINRNGGNNFRVNMKNFVTTGNNTAAFDPVFVDLIAKSDSSIRNELYTIPDFGDGLNHSETSGDGDLSIPIQGSKQLRPYQLGSFADPTWGADIYKG